jgi:CP family cyanate transporter-like MFS transporter
VAFGVLADGFGLRRSMLTGLGCWRWPARWAAWPPAPSMLMALRAAEGFGFLLVVLPAPGLVRQLVPPQRLSRAMGLWGAYMPLATGLALLLGPLVIEAAGWRAWWWGLAAVSALMMAAWCCAVCRRHPGGAAGHRAALDPAPAPHPGRARPLAAGLTFACYSGPVAGGGGFPAHHLPPGRRRRPRSPAC